MEYIRKKIKNGVHFTYVDTDKFKTDYLSVCFNAPIKKETASLNAVLPLVLVRATKSYDNPMLISTELDMLYDSEVTPKCQKLGETQIFGITMDCIDNAYIKDGTDVFGKTLDIMSEMLFSPKLENGAFIEKYVNSEKEHTVNSIKSLINNKRRYAISRLESEMFSSEPFAIDTLGTVEDVMAITPSSLFEHYKKVIFEYNIEIFFVGKFSKEVEDKILASFNFSDREDIPFACEFIKRSSKPKEITEYSEVSQSNLVLGYRTGNRLSNGDFYKQILLCEIFGHGTTSKLFMNVREKLSLCYFCSSYTNALKGCIFVSSGIEKENKELALIEIEKQLDNIKNGVISDEELDNAIKSIADSYNEIDDSPSRMESWFYGRLLADLQQSPTQALELIKKITKDDIASSAADITLDTVYFLTSKEAE